MKYSIDTSAIYDGWVRYPYDIFSPLWAKIEALIDQGELAATCEVLDEIQRRDEHLYAWAKSHKKMFIALDNEVQIAARKILNDHQRLVDTIKGRSMVDPWIIALAKVNKCAVVTHERLSTKPDHVRIPNVCAALDIRYLTFLEMIREEGWKLG